MKVGMFENRVWYYCPGCQNHHHIVTPRWTFNGDTEKPTFTPSIKVFTETTTICHHFVTNGMIQYLSDCEHKLKDQTIKMEDFNAWQLLS